MLHFRSALSKECVWNGQVFNHFHPLLSAICSILYRCIYYYIHKSHLLQVLILDKKCFNLKVFCENIMKSYHSSWVDTTWFRTFAFDKWLPQWKISLKEEHHYKSTHIWIEHFFLKETIAIRCDILLKYTMYYYIFNG